MSKVFDAYAAYYDLLYQHKDYAGEASYIDSLIRHYQPDVAEILELGCGTGSHARELEKLGYVITGVDRSEAMIRLAKAHSMQVGSSVSFIQGDLKAFRDERRFDVVLALFHVMSYQESNTDLTEAVTTAAVHLRPGGLFVFDCWYGPGVLTDPPQARTRQLKGDGLTVTRFATPTQHPNEDIVDVHYEIVVEGPDSRQVIEETHTMRYLFAPEVDLLLHAAGLRRIALKAWMSGDEPDLHTWNACFVAVR